MKALCSPYLHFDPYDARNTKLGTCRQQSLPRGKMGKIWENFSTEVWRKCHAASGKMMQHGAGQKQLEYASVILSIRIHQFQFT